MSHYSCKECGLRYDDCVCAKGPESKPAVVPDDGKHWKSDGAMFSKCLNCRQGRGAHLMNRDEFNGCPPSKEAPELSDARLRVLIYKYFGRMPGALENAYIEFARHVERETRGG